jgi:hypothetical protein
MLIKANLIDCTILLGCILGLMFFSYNIILFQPSSSSGYFIGSCIVLCLFLYKINFSHKLTLYSLIIITICLSLLYAKSSAIGLFVVLGFMLNSFLAFIILNKKFNLTHLDKIALFCVAYTLNLLFIGFLIWILSHFKINYFSSYLAIYVFEFFVLLVLNNLNFYNLHIFLKSPLSSIEKYFFIPGIFFIFLSFMAYDLNIDGDAFIKHFYIPEYIKYNHFFHYNPEEPVSFDISGIIPTYVYTFLYLIGGKSIFGLINILNFCLGVFLITASVKKFFGTKEALFAALIIIFTPIMMLEYSTLFIDSFSFLFASLITYIFLKIIYEKRVEQIPLLIFLGNISLLSKLQMVYILIPFYVYLFIFHIKIIKSNFKTIFIASLSSSIFLCIPMIYNFIVTSNPLYPWFNGIFKSEYFMLTSFKDSRWSHALDLSFLYDITFHGSKFVEQADKAYSFGFLYMGLMLFVPFIFFSKNFIKNIIILLVFFSSIYVWYITTGTYMRYFLIIMPLGTFVLMIIFNAMLTISKQACTKFLLFTYLSLLFLGNLIFFSKDHALLPRIGFGEKALITRYNEGLIDFYRRVALLIKNDSKILSLIDAREKALYLPGIYSRTMFDWKFYTELQKVMSVDELENLLRKREIHYIAARKDLLENEKNQYILTVIRKSKILLEYKIKTGHEFIVFEIQDGEKNI